MSAALVIDPGASAGLALVQRLTARSRHPFQVIKHSRIHGRRGLWLERAAAEIDNALEAARFAGLEISTVVIEEPAPASRSGSLAGDKRGQRTWFGIGRRVGAIEAIAPSRGLTVSLLTARDWTRALSLPASKASDTGQRVTLAERLTGLTLTTTSTDTVEAILMGCAVAQGAVDVRLQH